MTVNSFIEELNKYKKWFWKTTVERLGECYTGLYWGKLFICWLPPYNIYKHSYPEYISKRGARHKGILEVVDILSGHGVIKFDEWLQLKHKAMRW